METSDREDLLVARTDGTEYRRLTNDTFRNRAPVWTPDGAALIFYSNRGGDYGIWTIKTDGSGAERLISGYVFNIPTLAPDGRQIAAASTTRAEWRIFTRSESGFSAGPLRKEPGAETNFTPTSWSDDGLRLAGVVRRADGFATAIAVSEIASETFTLLPAPGSFCPVWLPDGRRLIYRDGAGVWLGEPATGRRKQLISVGGYFTGRSLGIARDGTWITYTDTGTDGKVWLAIMKQP
jgi:Tol biopolymer transport system component